MIAPMTLIAVLCAMIGFFPALVLPLLNEVLGAWMGNSQSRLAELVPCAPVTTFGLLLVVAAGIGFALFRRRLPRRRIQAAVTWDCGYARPTDRMQYTSSSFADMLVGLFRWVLRPQIHLAPPVGLFPGQSTLQSHVPEIVLDGWLNPFWRRLKTRLASARASTGSRSTLHPIHPAGAVCIVDIACSDSGTVQEAGRPLTAESLRPRDAQMSGV